MDVQQKFTCACGENSITLSFSESMPAAVIDVVYCPRCKENGHPHLKAWPIPGDWFLHFDLEVARMFSVARLDIDPALVNPGFIIDRGFVH
ncbi:MAG: hypothetical protein P8X39_05325 [Desulfofustis sp.]|jgi:hypothetical protein